MKYDTVVSARFLARPNRFIAQVELEGQEVIVHVKNTGRCRELLVPGCTVFLEKAANPNRKTPYDLIAVEKGSRLINMDAQAPNRLFLEWAQAGKFRPGLTLLRPETSWGSSRFDFYWEGRGKRGFVEVKGCTLEENGWTYFPDAPTERGVKHLHELLAAKREGYEATLFVAIQMANVRGFSPNDRTHPAFGEALREAAQGGVEVLAYACDVTPQEAILTCPVPVGLWGEAELCAECPTTGV